MQKLPCIRHYRVKKCKPWLFSTFAGLREREIFVPDENNLSFNNF